MTKDRSNDANNANNANAASGQSLRLFRTPPHACSYLEGQSANTVYLDPEIPPTRGVLSLLNEVGYRRSGANIYRPDCDDCSACLSVRIPVSDFEQGRRFRRVLRKNSELSVRQIDEEIAGAEARSLYQRYIASRHDDGDMYPADDAQYDSFILDASDATTYFGFYDDQRLLAVTVCDVLSTGLSAVYTFFEPSAAKRSLGTFAVLSLIQIAREMGLAYVFLGYWVKGCSKMEYKIDYRPIELFQDKKWVRLN